MRLQASTAPQIWTENVSLHGVQLPTPLSQEKLEIMKAYVGQTRATELVNVLASLGIGECVVRGEIPPRRTPWFYDNGAFGDWKAKRNFDAVRYTRDLFRIREWDDLPEPDFIVLPDIVAGGAESLVFSLYWLEDSMAAGVPLYLAVQDGMTEADVEATISTAVYEGGRIDGIFVGGSLEWKLETGEAWTKFAHYYDMQCHIGRVGTADRVRWAKAIGCDSIDSCLPLWTTQKLHSFIDALFEEAAA
jgi:hypothetical protein